MESESISITKLHIRIKPVIYGDYKPPEYEYFDFSELFDVDVFDLQTRREAYIYICSRLIACSVVRSLSLESSEYGEYSGVSPLRKIFCDLLKRLWRDALDPSMEINSAPMTFFDIFGDDSVECVNNKILFVVLSYFTAMNDFAHLRRTPNHTQADIQCLRGKLIEEVSTILEFFACGLEEDLVKTQEGQEIDDRVEEQDGENTYKCSEACKETSIKKMLHKSAFNA